MAVAISEATVAAESLAEKVTPTFPWAGVSPEWMNWKLMASVPSLMVNTWPSVILLPAGAWMPRPPKSLSVLSPRTCTTTGLFTISALAATVLRPLVSKATSFCASVAAAESVV